MEFKDWYLEFLKEDKTGLSDRELLFIAFEAGCLHKKQKIQTALAETSNWNCKEVLTKLLEDK